MIFPWQQTQWQMLGQAIEANRLPHALLFTGVAGTGKTIFADCFARALLCRYPHRRQADLIQQACTCHPCRLIKNRVHPNVLWITPEKEGQPIRVDQIREVSEFVHHASWQNTYRIAIIHPAEQMNLNAANALLKTLEEPPPGALLVLISDQSSPLPLTLLSRCQRVLFPRPKKEEAYTWLVAKLPNPTIDLDLLLKLAHGAPLAALNLAKDNIFSVRQALFDDLYLLHQQQGDPIRAAIKQQAISSLQFIDFMLSWITDLLQLQLGKEVTEIINIDYKTSLAELKHSTLLKKNINFMNYLLQSRAQVGKGIHLNKQLLVEQVFMRWMTGN